MVFLHHQPRVGEEKVGVGLQMHQSTVDEKAAVTLHEIGGGESLAWIFHLRVRECQPNLLYLILSKEAVDDLNARTQECYIGHPVLQSQFGTCPHACALDVHTDEVDVGEEFSQSHGVLSFAAAKLQHDGIVVMEILFPPMTFHVEGHIVDDGEWILEDIAHRLHLCKLG